MATWHGEDIPFVRADFSSMKAGKYQKHQAVPHKVTGIWVAYYSGYQKDVKVVIFPHGSHLSGLMPNREREKRLYRMIPLIGLMYKTFGKYRKENLGYFAESEKEIIDWVKA